MTERLMRSAACIIMPCLFLAGGVYAQRNSSTSDGTRAAVDVSAPFGKNFSESTHNGGILLIGSNVYEAHFEKHRLVMKVPQPSVSTGGKAVTLGERLETSEGPVAYAAHSGEVVCEGRTMFSAGEFIVDTTLGYGAAVGAQSRPAVAFDGENYLVVWQDDERGGDIYGSRVTPDGVVLDSAGIVISRAVNRQIYPAVAFDGANYLVVWQDYRSDPDGDVYGARVSRTGVVLDPAGIAISTAGNRQEWPAVDSDGSECMVAWQDYRSNIDADLFATRVNRTGNVLDPNGICISAARYGQGHPGVAFGGVNFFVVWFDLRRTGSDIDIYGARVGSSGNVIDTGGIAISTAVQNQHYPVVSSNGSNYLVVWQDGRNSGWDIYATRVSLSGSVLDTAGIRISAGIISSTMEAYFPCATSGGSNYLVVWSDMRNGDSDTYGCRVADDGTVLDPNGIPIAALPTSQGSAAAAFDGVNYQTVWHDYRSGVLDIYGARLSQNGRVLDSLGRLVSFSHVACAQAKPSVAFDGVNYLVVWRDERKGYHIYGARVSQGGLTLDPAPVTIETGAFRCDYPAVAFDGTNYFVVWQDERSGGDIYGSRVTPGGVVVDSAGIAISRAASGQLYPAVAFDGENYLVVWQDYRSDPDGDVYGARVSRTGVVLDPAGIAISTAEYGQAQPAVAFDDTNYLVVWDDRRSLAYDIRGARIAPSGTVLDTSAVGISLASNDQNYPSVAFDGTNYLVVWQDYRRDGNGDIYGARVSRAGDVLDSLGIGICTAVYGQWEPAVGFEGINFMVGWQDRRSNSSWDIYGARVSPTGLIADSLLVSQQTRDQVSPVVGIGTSGKSLIVYAGWCDTINGHFARVARIWGKVVLHLGIEEDPRRLPHGLRTCETTLSACPSPARSRAVKIKYSLARTATVRLVIFNSLGQVEEVLVGGQRKAGIYERAPSKKLGSGVYFIHLDDGSMALMRKIIIVD